VIDIRGLVKRYDRRTAVDGLTLQVPAGSCYALLGPNGAGKTTTVKVLTGLVRPDQGRVFVAGHDIRLSGDAARGQLGYVPDQPYLYEKLSGREFLVFVGRMYGLPVPDVQKGIAELAERFELLPFMDELAESYSHGMRQRVVFASALLHRPKVLVVDEPTVGLDPKSIRLIKDLLREQAKRGAAVLMSTHILDVAEAVADRVGIMSHGRLLAEGSPAEIRSRVGSGASLEDAFLALTDEGPRRRVSDF
jgi:ABC-2 type transport system ATP-binding protein